MFYLLLFFRLHIISANHQINVKFIEQQRQITIDQDELIATLDAYFQAEGEEEA